ncbi:hypothetical protein [Streptomyces sp. AC555_RSS877]|uniref:effector-associated constant component EACC1 n=1 Tax=Streptomyces sp. AC555_RSS877 TaxID=2823688 RepID=UPI0027E4840E|nr:hypothetical protein [Streptomyces sp. AC555_RSS877]
MKCYAMDRQLSAVYTCLRITSRSAGQVSRCTGTATRIRGTLMSGTVRIQIDSRMPGDLLRSLHGSLSGEPEWRGRVGLVEGPSRKDALGGGLEALTVALAPGGLAVGLVSAVVAWARSQSVGEMVCKLSRSDGSSVEVSAPLARSLHGADEVRALVEELSQRLGDGSPGVPSGE